MVQEVIYKYRIWQNESRKPDRRKLFYMHNSKVSQFKI